MQTRAGRQVPQAGFGLIELIIVVGIIAVLTAILSLSIRQVRASYALRHAAEIVVSETRRAQASSIAQGADYMVEFIATNPGALKVYKDNNGDHVFTGSETTPVREVSGQDWPSTIQILADTDTTVPSLAVCNAPGVTAGNCVTVNAPYVTFGFFGAPNAAGDVQLKGETGGITRIQVEIATGRVSVE